MNFQTLTRAPKSNQLVATSRFSLKNDLWTWVLRHKHISELIESTKYAVALLRYVGYTNRIYYVSDHSVTVVKVLFLFRFLTTQGNTMENKWVDRRTIPPKNYIEKLKSTCVNFRTRLSFRFEYRLPCRFIESCLFIA